MCRTFWRKIDFNCFYEHSSFAGASGACPAPGGAFAPAKVLDPAPGGAFAPAKFFDPAPGGGKAPAKFLDPAPGGAFAPAKIFDPAPGGARPRRGRGLAGAYPGPRNSLIIANVCARKYIKSRPIL